MNGQNAETAALLRKLLILELAELGVPQGTIAKKLRMNINTVNEFLSGIKRIKTTK